MVEVVIDNYFNPHVDDIRKSLEAKMPGLLAMTGSTAPKFVIQQILPQLRAMTSENWKRIQDELVVKVDTPFPIESEAHAS